MLNPLAAWEHLLLQQSAAVVHNMVSLYAPDTQSCLCLHTVAQTSPHALRYLRCNTYGAFLSH